MTPQDIHAKLVARFGEAIVAFEAAALDPWIVVRSDALAEVAAFAKSDPDLAFDNLMCLAVVDWPKEVPPRMDVVYHLYSYAYDHTFVLKVHLPRESPHVATASHLWGVANWHEREAFDLFGVVFDGHPDLRRILLPDDWVGFPLRKDWQDPEFYNGLHCKPTPQMADRFAAGEAIGVGPFEFTPPNRSIEER